VGVTLIADEVGSMPPDGRTGRGRPLTLVAGAGAVVVGAVYPVTASLVSPVALPAVGVAILLFVISLRRPGVGVAVAFVLASLTPGLAGSRSWVPGVVWTATLVAVLAASRPALRAGEPAASLPPLGLPVLLYGGTMMAAYAVSPAPELGFHLLRNAVAGILLFLVASTSLRSWQDITTALRGTSLSALIVGGLACLQYLRGASTGIGFVTSSGVLVARETAGFIHPNLLGGFLVALVPLAAGAAIIDRPWRLVHVTGLVLALGGIYLSFSRGAILAVLLMPLLLLRGRWIALLVPAALITLAVGVPPVMTERFALGGQDGGQIAGRRDIWSTAGSIWIERPLLGTGLGGFPGAYAAVRVSGKQFLPDTRFQPPPHAHNLELQLLAEQGLVGFCAFGAVVVTTGRHVRRLRSSRSRRQAALGAALLAWLAGILLHNLFDATLVENAGVQFWGVLGLLSAAIRLGRAEAGVGGG